MSSFLAPFRKWVYVYGTQHITLSIIPSFGTDPTHKMLSKFKLLGRQESQTAVTVAFKVGPINATDKISKGRSKSAACHETFKISKQSRRDGQQKSEIIHIT